MQKYQTSDPVVSSPMIGIAPRATPINSARAINSNSQIAMRGPLGKTVPRISFNNNRPSYQPQETIISRIPMHQSVYINRPSQRRSPPRSNSPQQGYNITINRPSPRQTVLSPLPVGQPVYRELKSPQEVDYSRYPHLQTITTKQNLHVPSMPKPLENKDSDLIERPKYQKKYRDSGITPRRSALEEQPEDNKTCCSLPLLALLGALALIALIIALVLALNSLSAPKINDHSVPPTNVEIDNYKKNGTAVVVEKNVIQSKKSSPSNVIISSDSNQANGFTLATQNQVPHTQPGIPRPKPDTQPGLTPGTSYRYPQTGKIPEAPKPIIPQYSQPITLDTQIPIESFNTDFQYPPDSSLYNTEYETSFKKTLITEPRIQHDYSSKRKMFHRLSYQVKV